MDNDIHIYSGEIDEEEDSPEVKELRVSLITPTHPLNSPSPSPSPRLQDAMPFAVVGSTTLLEVSGKRVRGRLYPWGVVESE